MATKKDLVIKQGKTCALVLRWELDTILYKAITAIQQTAPVRLTCTGHEIPDGWRGAVTNVKGMTEINAVANEITDRDYKQITVIDPNTVELNAVNAAGFKPYVSGGHLQINTPVDLTGYSARMSIKDKVGGSVLAADTANVSVSPLNIIALTIDTAKKTITLLISATNTAAITWLKGVYEVEMVGPTGIVDAVLTGPVTVTKEVTT